MSEAQNIRTLKEFGANLRRLRVEKGLSQERLAELAELNPRTVQKIEAGQTNILITTAIRMQKHLDCEWDDLMPVR